MQELRLVAVSEDGSYAVLVVPGRSGRFALPIDERLRTVARGQFSRLAQYEIEVESPLRPKEIQDRIRAGETAEEIADAAGLPVDRIRRFEGPVLAEREFRATEAQRATVRGPGESGLAPRLGEIVAQRLADLGANAEDAEWDSRKRQDGNWQVQLAYTIAGRMHVAEWVYDPRGKHVTPDDDEAVRLSLDEAHWPGPRQSSAAAATATVTPIGSRAASASGAPAAIGSRHSDHRAEPDRGARAMPHPSRQPLPVTATSADRQASVDRPAANQDDAGGARPEQDDPKQAEPREAKPRETQPSEAQPREVQQQPRPAKRATGGRSRRSSVPSWDEIMFGNSRQPE
jgi:Protein of unknown function (DUF3071)